MSKVKVTYNMPSDDDSATVTMGGVRFFDGQAIDLDADKHEHLIGKLRTNQHFKVAGAKTAEKTSERETVTGLKAVHVAGGRFVIKNGNDVVKEGLNKADADAFNALDDADKAAYVAD